MINGNRIGKLPDILCVIIFLLFSTFSIFSKFFSDFVGVYIYYIIAIITAVVYIIASIIIVRKSDSSFKKFVISKRFRLKMLPGTIYCAISVCLATILINLFVYNLFNIKSGADINPLLALGENASLLSFISLALVPAIFEELFFRGAYFSTYKRTGIYAILASGLAFAFMHATPFNFIGPLIAGIMFCVLTFIYESIYPAILAHLINNIFVLALSIYGEGINKSGLGGIFVVALVIGLLIFIYLFIGQVIKFTHKIKDKPIYNLTQRVDIINNPSKPFNVWFWILGGLFVLKSLAMLFGVWE